MATEPGARTGWLTAGLCFIVALLEGFDLQSVGIAAAGIRAEFGLNPTQLGWMFSAGLVGLLPGAFAGGMLADRFGRKRVLLVAVLVFGLASLATAYAWDLPSLLVTRLLTGLGIGAALPMVIALAAESAEARSKGLAVSVTFCGIPLGGACAALIGMSGGGFDWRMVFHIGGYAPVAVALLLGLLLPESRQFVQARQAPAVEQDGKPGLAGLFADDLGRPTLLLWISSFFTLTVLYMLLNWLPSLLLAHGFTRAQAGQVQILFNLGGAGGAILTGWMMDRSHAMKAVLLTYGAILLGLAGLGFGSGAGPVLAAAAVAGYGLMGGQSLLYALAPALYPTRIRATGVGVSVAVGRLGSVSGPLLAGKLLAGGAGIGGIVAAVAPGIVLAAGGVLVLLGRSALSGRAIGGAAANNPISKQGDQINEASRIS